MKFRLILILSFVMLIFSCSKNDQLYKPTPKIDPYTTYKEGLKAFKENQYFFASKQFAKAEIRRIETTGNMQFLQKQNSSKIIQGEFSLKNLIYFIKCTNLCNQIEIYLENDLPLVIKYHVASLGEIKLCLAPLPST